SRPSRGVQSRLSCVLQLKQIGSKFNEYALANGGHYPMTVSTNMGGTLEYVDNAAAMFRHFEVALSNDSSPRYLICPQDSRQSAKNWSSLDNHNISYFLMLDASNPGSEQVLIGDRNIANLNNIIVSNVN